MLALCNDEQEEVTSSLKMIKAERLRNDEQDPNEKAFNDGARSFFRSPRIQNRLANLNKVLNARPL
jgi:hypothetical protein